jgi:hypothetical protein
MTTRYLYHGYQLRALDPAKRGQATFTLDPPARTCRACGCTDEDCAGCISRTGTPCHWVAADLCSACVPGESAETGQGALMELPESALRRPEVRGHAALPGTGPAGETCGSCHHCVRRGGRRTFPKCLLARGRWTGGKGSDIRRKDPACAKWEAISTT